MPHWNLPRKSYRNDDAADGAVTEIRIAEKDSSPSSMTNNRLYFYGDISEETALNWNKQLDELSKNLKVVQTIYELQNPPIIYIYIHSAGGDLFAALSVLGRIEQLKDKGFLVHTIVDGYCASAATLISIAGNKRFLQRHGCMLIHQLSSSFWGTYNQFQDEKRNVELMMEQIKVVYRTYTTFEEKDLNEILSHDIYLYKDECLKQGLIDEVL